MTTNVAVETLDAVKRKLVVEIPSEDVQSEMDVAYGELMRSARVPGFRQGKAPRKVLERMFGDSVRADVFTRLVQKSFSDAVREHHLHPLAAPEIVTEKAEPGTALRYTAVVEVRPEIASAHYSGLEVNRPQVNISDADVDAQLERMRQSLAQLHPIEDRTDVRAGDVVNLDYEARVAGRIVSKSQGRDVEIGSNPFPPELDAHVTGAEIGQSVAFSVDYPADGPPEVAGKTVEFKVQIHRLSRKELPTLDDDFAKDQGEFATMDELRARIRSHLEAEAGRSADEVMRRELLSELAKANDVPIPESLVRRRTEALVEEVCEDWRRQRIMPKSESEAREALYVDMEPRAREQVKIGMLLDVVARDENIVVGDEEVDARIEAMASEAGAAAERLRAMYQNEEVRHQLQARLVQSRTIDLLASRAKITDVSPSSRVADVVENG